MLNEKIQMTPSWIHFGRPWFNSNIISTFVHLLGNYVYSGKYFKDLAMLDHDQSYILIEKMFLNVNNDPMLSWYHKINKKLLCCVAVKTKGAWTTSK